MKNDEAHGPAQQYPEGFDPDNGTYSPPEGETRETPEEPAHNDSQGATEVGDELGGGDRDDEPRELDLDDDPSQFRTYECPSCETAIEQYGDEECPNGHSQTWVAT